MYSYDRYQLFSSSYRFFASKISNFCGYNDFYLLIDNCDFCLEFHRQALKRMSGFSNLRQFALFYSMVNFLVNIFDNKCTRYSKQYIYNSELLNRHVFIPGSCFEHIYIKFVCVKNTKEPIKYIVKEQMICHNEKSILRDKINNFICCKYWLKKPAKSCPEKDSSY